MNLQVYVLDGHPIVVEGLTSLLAADGRLSISAGSLHSELYKHIQTETPDLIIMGYEQSHATAMEVLSYLRKKLPDTPVLIYTMHTEPWIIKLLVKSEVAGIVIKSERLEEMTEAVQTVLFNHQKYYSPMALNVLLSIMGDNSAAQALEYVPSPSECEVIYLLSLGLTSKDIAEKLHLSKHTIDSMRKEILLKSGAVNVSNLMRLAFMRGWITE